MLNILLTDKKMLAEQEGIRFVITVQCSGLGFIEPVDVTVLFANLLDNVLEACRQCKGKKEIHVSIRSYNEKVSIRIENTVEKEVQFSPEGRPIRENGKQGGIGILNVEKCVEKYNGNVLYWQENGKLYSDVLLNQDYIREIQLPVFHGKNLYVGRFRRFFRNCMYNKKQQETGCCGDFWPSVITLFRQRALHICKSFS